MIRPRDPWIAWPGWAHIRLALLLAAAHLSWFGFVYGGSNWIASLRQNHVRIYFDWELGIPLVPALTPVYMSIYIPMIMAPFVLRKRTELLALVFAIATVVFCGGICFLLLPSEPAYAEPTNLGAWHDLYWFARHMALHYNMLPSLHVALSSLCLAALARRAGWTLKLVLGAWSLLIAAATVLIHAHHVADVFAGYVLSGLVYRWVFLPRVDGNQAPAPEKLMADTVPEGGA